MPDGQVENPPFLAWNLDFDADFTLAKDTVAVGLGMYEMTKLRQCLLGVGECPTVSSSKTLRLTIPVSECQGSPRIMYRCYEDNDPDTVVTEGTEVLDTMDFNFAVAKKYGVRGFEHVMQKECMDKIQFAIECDGKQELHELDNSRARSGSAKTARRTSIMCCGTTCASSCTISGEPLRVDRNAAVFHHAARERGAVRAHRWGPVVRLQHNFAPTGAHYCEPRRAARQELGPVLF